MIDVDWQDTESRVLPKEVFRVGAQVVLSSSHGKLLRETTQLQLTLFPFPWF
jgi:hypothetical protein